MRSDAVRLHITENLDQTTPIPFISDRSDRIILLRSAIERGSDASAAEGRMHDATIAAMRDAGLFRMLQPRRYGGGETGPAEFFETQAELASCDMSAGWLHGTMGVLAFHLALFPEQAQDDVWGDRPDALMASSYMQTGRATPVAGGYQVEGVWHFASGADHANWFVLGAVATGTDGNADRFVILVPRGDATVRREWHASGLKATGSQGVVLDDCFVPAHRVHGIRERFEGRSPGLAVNKAALYRIPLPQLQFRVISTPAIGALRGLLDALLVHNRDRVGVTGVAASDDPIVLLACGQAAAALDELMAVQRASLGRMLDHARCGGEAPIADRMIYRLQAASVVDRCSRLALRLFQAAGTSGLSLDKPFARYLADIQASRQHVANQFEGYGRALGRALLGDTAEDTLL